MANHVSGYLSIRNISEEGQQVWDKIVSDLEAKQKEGEYEIHLGHYVFDDLEKDWDFNTMCEEVGAKWAYATDMDESGMAMYSAWSPCVEFCQNIAQKIGEVDETVKLVLTYEDEFPNFAGVATFDKDGTNTDNQIDWDDISRIIRDNDEELAKLWNEEEEEYTDEDAANDILCEIQWDYINEWQSDNEEW